MDQQIDNGIRKDYLLPASIVIAALLISGSWIYTSGTRVTPPAGGGTPTDTGRPPVADTTTGMKPVAAEDHILGNPDAPVKVVEYSDLECPFCKMFHPTMKQIMREYGKDGRVAWVYRHFPLESLHRKAKKESEASECAAELGGNEKFWAYVDRVFEVTPSNDGLDPAELPAIAAAIGLDRAPFESCLASGRYAKKVAVSVEDAERAGARGTPYSIVLSKSGRQFPINGALPFEQVRPIIEEALR